MKHHPEMSDLDSKVSTHYSVGDLQARIFAALEAAGKNLDGLRV